MAGTVRLAPDLDEPLKKRALKTGVSVTRLVNDTLRAMLNQPPPAPARRSTAMHIDEAQDLTETQLAAAQTAVCTHPKAQHTAHSWGTVCSCGKRIR